VGRLEDGRVVFVPFTIEGEVVEAQIVRERRQLVEARLVEVVSASPHRVEPRCQYFGRCGGCAYQHMDAAEQLRVKHKQVAQTLRRLGRVEIEVSEIVPSPLAYEYRNRITVHCQDGAVGFIGVNGRDLVDIAECPIAEPAVNRALAALRGRRWREDGHATLRADPSRRTFHQTNDGAAAELLRVVSECLPDAGERLVDAYCGAGFFSHALRARFQEVIGLEWDERAVAQAEREAADNERYVCGDVAERLGAVLTAAPGAGRTHVLLDPPATGLAAPVRETLLREKPAEIVYVSCDPSTLARDLAALSAAYEPLAVIPVDMFPQTAEIEVVAHLRTLKL
jgi:tRNA/tmRNA/rRNA uracil-C5-methylase (TrmA/RlmC/RlmD family)